MLAADNARTCSRVSARVRLSAARNQGKERGKSKGRGQSEQRFDMVDKTDAAEIEKEEENNVSDLANFLNTMAGWSGPTWSAERAGWHEQDRGCRDRQGRQRHSLQQR